MLDALPEEFKDPIRAGRIEYIREIIRALAFQVAQVSSARCDLHRAAHIVKLSGNDLLRVD